MRVVAALNALWLCGTEKCPFDYATDGDSADSENKGCVRGQLHAFLSNKKSGLLTPGQSRSRAIRTRWIHF